MKEIIEIEAQTRHQVLMDSVQQCSNFFLQAEQITDRVLLR